MTSLTPRLSLRVLSALVVVLASAAAAWGQTPITACGFEIAQSGLFRVTQNLTASVGQDCIVILDNVSDVTIDLRGHTLTGPEVGSGIETGIFGTDANTNIIIHNGRMRNFSAGVYLTNSEVVTLDELVVSQNQGTGITVGPRATITHTKANDNKGAGIVLSGHATLDTVTVAGNHWNGIYSVECCVTVTRVQALDNGKSDTSPVVGGRSGIELRNGGHVVTQSTADDNREHGILLDGDRNVVVGSVARKNGEYGIYVDGGTSNTVLDSVAHRNVAEGIRFVGIWRSSSAAPRPRTT